MDAESVAFGNSSGDDIWLCGWGSGDGRGGRDRQCRGVEIGADGSVDTCAEAGVERLGEKRGRPAPSGTIYRALGGERKFVLKGRESRMGSVESSGSLDSQKGRVCVLDADTNLRVSAKTNKLQE